MFGCIFSQLVCGLKMYQAHCNNSNKIWNKGLHTLVGMGWAAFAAAVPYPGKATRISHKGQWSTKTNPLWSKIWSNPKLNNSYYVLFLKLCTGYHSTFHTIQNVSSLQAMLQPAVSQKIKTIHACSITWLGLWTLPSRLIQLFSPVPLKAWRDVWRVEWVRLLLVFQTHKRFKRTRFIMTKQHNKTAQPKTDKYPTSRFHRLTVV